MSRREILIVKVVFIFPSAHNFSWNEEQWMWMRSVYCMGGRGLLPKELHTERNCGNNHCECLKHSFSILLFPFLCLPRPPLMPTSLSAFVFILCNKGQGRIVQRTTEMQKCPFSTRGDITLHIPTGSDSKGKKRGTNELNWNIKKERI